jgi:poly(3-hydroxybutyrate) depolymerase
MRDKGEPALIASLTRAVQREYNADPLRTYIAGLSAGGAAAVVVATAYPDIFSAVGVHSGLAAGSAHDVPSAFAAMRSGAEVPTHQIIMPTIVFHGLADATVHPKNGLAVISQALHAMPHRTPTVRRGHLDGKRPCRMTAYLDPAGCSQVEHWEIEGAGHAWAGGKSAGSYTDPDGPDASRHIMRFFLQHRLKQDCR